MNVIDPRVWHDVLAIDDDIYLCHWEAPYGWVVEAGCPRHDAPIGQIDAYLPDPASLARTIERSMVCCCTCHDQGRDRYYPGGLEHDKRCCDAMFGIVPTRNYARIWREVDDALLSNRFMGRNYQSGHSVDANGYCNMGCC